MTKTFVPSLLGLAACAAVAAPAAATGIIFPPPGSNSFIELYETDSGQSVCSLVCAFASSTSPAVTLPNFSSSTVHNFLTATGDVTPTAIHSFVSGNVGVEYDLATQDTYTVHGGVGPFPITITVAASGTTSTIGGGSFFIDLVPNITVRLGTLDIDPAAGIPIVSPFGVGAQATTVAPTLIGSTFQSESIGATATWTKMVNPGDVFDVAYELNTQFAEGTVDLSHTATLSFTLPNGVYLTSAGGSTFGTVPSAGVPEPASWALMIAGFGLMGASLRRRSSRAIGAASRTGT